MGAFYLDMHGLSHHFSDATYNERNTGAGVHWESQSEGMRTMAMVGSYLNSLDRQSIYIGGGVKYPLARGVDAVMQGGLVTGYYNYPVPTAMPGLSIGGETMRVNIGFIPAIKNVTPAVITMSLQFRIGR